MTRDDIFIAAIDEALRQSNGNKTKAAFELAIAIRTLRNWINIHPELKRWRLPPPAHLKKLSQS